MLDDIHKGLQSLSEATDDLQKTLFDLPRLEQEVALLLKLAGDYDKATHLVRIVSQPDAIDFHLSIPIEDLIAAKRAELTDAMITLQEAVQNADEAYARLCEFNWRHVPDVHPSTASYTVPGVMLFGDKARDLANEVA